jgi:hypothetical protein
MNIELHSKFSYNLMITIMQIGASLKITRNYGMFEEYWDATLCSPVVH